MPSGRVIRAPAGNALRGTNGSLCSLRVDALCKNPSVLQRCSNCSEARSPQTVWRWLASSLRLSRVPYTNAQLCAAQQVRCAPSSRLLRSPQPLPRLTAPGFCAAPRISPDSSRLRDSPTSPDCLRGRSARPYIGSVRPGFDLCSPTFDPPTGSAPSAVLIRISGEACTERTCVKTATLHGEGTPASVCSDAVRWELAVAGAKWRRFGDEGEAMLFVLVYWGRCDLGDVVRRRREKFSKRRKERIIH